MRTRLIPILGAMAAAMALLHCSSRDVEIGTVEDSGSVEAATPDAEPDTAIEADGGISDAATEDEYEVPDGAVVCDATPCVVALSGGFSATAGTSFCALLEDETVSCWGSNLQNQLGLEPDPDAGQPPLWGSAPRRIGALSEVTGVSTSGENTCVSIADGGVLCWGAAALVNAGRNVDPDAGQPSATAMPPTRMDRLPPASSIAVGAGAACVTTPEDALSCWGNNASAQLGRPPSKTYAPPAAVALDGERIVSAHPGAGRTFAVTKDGAVLSWGSASATCELTGECAFLLGRDTSEDPDPVPTPVPGLAAVRGLSTSASHACAIAGPRIECWGGNGGGELGRGTAVGSSSLPGPTILSTVTQAVAADAGMAEERDVPLQIVAGHGRSCAVMGSGRVYCWGALGTKNEWGRPRLVSGLSGPAVALALADGVGLTTACALLRSGAIECWGSNYLGALGRGNEDIFSEDPTPAPVLFTP